jgi:hypothetical protein
MAEVLVRTAYGKGSWDKDHDVIDLNELAILAKLMAYV